MRFVPALAAGAAATVVSLAAAGIVSAQPRVTGDVEIDLTGGIRGDVCISGVPIRGDTAVIVLNRALTVHRITGAHDIPISIELEPGGAARRYRLAGLSPDPAGPARRPTASACVRYGGVLPVHDVLSGDYRPTDEGSVIAFDGATVRARGAARWYPAPFDLHTGLAIEAVSYDLQVICRLCGVIYVNGGDPVESGEGRFESASPRELFLFAGDIPVTRTAAGRILGEVTHPDTAATFFHHLDDIQRFLADYVGVAYGPAPEIVRFTPVRMPRRGLLWGFLSDPALALSGMTIAEFVRALDENSPSRSVVFGFLAHELAHRYFGWGIGVHSRQRDLFSEPFATYLELKAVRHFHGEAEYLAAIGRVAVRAAAADVPFPPLDRAGPDDLAAPTYSYGFGPLQLIALEFAIGEERFVEILRTILLAEPAERDTADYAFMRRIGVSSGVPERRWRDWEARCLRTEGALRDCLPDEIDPGALR